MNRIERESGLREESGGGGGGGRGKGGVKW